MSNTLPDFPATFVTERVVTVEKLSQYIRAVQALGSRAYVEVLAQPNQKFSITYPRSGTTVEGKVKKGDRLVRVSGWFPPEQGLAPFWDEVRRIEQQDY